MVAVKQSIAVVGSGSCRFPIAQCQFDLWSYARWTVDPKPNRQLAIGNRQQPRFWLTLHL